MPGLLTHRIREATNNIPNVHHQVSATCRFYTEITKEKVELYSQFMLLNDTVNHNSAAAKLPPE